MRAIGKNNGIDIILPTLIHYGRGLHALQIAGLTVAMLAAGTADGRAAMPDYGPALAAYDTALGADSMQPVAKLTEPVVLTGTAGVPFDFGASSGDATMEFIVEGDPVATSGSGFLAVGEIPSSSLRYEAYNNTSQLGFTQGGVADYLFTPGVPSPVQPTHIAYTWNATDYVMKVYVNGRFGGATTNVSDVFAMPSGAGLLGAASETGGDAMVGTIYRVAAYDEIESDAAILRHANAFTSLDPAPIIFSLTATPGEILGQKPVVISWETLHATALYLNNADVTGTTNQTVSPLRTTTYTLIASNAISTATAKVTVSVNPLLTAYDAAIAADQAAGLTPVASLTNVVDLTGTAGAPFDFGTVSGDETIEFIVEGDPAATGASGYLAVGESASSNLRYEQYNNTAQLGFTRSGVADYLFTPNVSSPTFPTHIVYLWNSAALSMKVYVNGVLAGEVNNVSDAFVMPSGMGTLGAISPGGGEAMVGRIHRVVVYDQDLTEAAIKRHADAFTSVVRPPIISSFTATPGEIVGQGSSILSWQTLNATALFVNNAVVTGTNLTVSPQATTAYTLTASNAFAVATAKVTVVVSPLLKEYDAAIAADAAGGLTPLASLTNFVSFAGTSGSPFDFGPGYGDMSIEFILEGDPAASGDSAYLAVGETSTSSLRYEQYQNTAQLGFTQIGVADYLFTPAVPSPVAPTHLVYVWNSVELSMKLYLNGALSATVEGVSDAFTMPTGMGSLGATATGGEAIVGTIYRVEVYSGVLPEATILRHARAFTGAQRGPSISLDVKGALPAITLEQGVSGSHYRIEYRNTLSAADSWQTLQDIPSLSGTSIRVEDSTSLAGRSQRFYRAVLVP